MTRVTGSEGWIRVAPVIFFNFLIFIYFRTQHRDVPKNNWLKRIDF